MPSNFVSPFIIFFICIFGSFIITDLKYNGDGGDYILNLNMSVCLESKHACDPVIPVFVNTLLPKGLCNRNQDFKDKGLAF